MGELEMFRLVLTRTEASQLTVMVLHYLAMDDREGWLDGESRKRLEQLAETLTAEFKVRG